MEEWCRAQGMPVTASTKAWKTDEWFGHQRVSGTFPLGIRRVRGALPSHVRVSEQQVEGLLDPLHPTLMDAVEAGRIFIVDYSEDLRDIPLTAGGFLANPVCVLYTPPAQPGTFMPLAIQLFSSVDTDEPAPRGSLTITPNDNHFAWQLAKLHFQVAEAQWEFFGVRCLHVHLAALYASVTYRCLSARHPIRQLLQPHLAGAICTNNWIEAAILRPGGFADTLFAIGRPGATTLARRGCAGFSLHATGFTDDIFERNMDGVAGYAYAEDSRLIWDTIHKYVSGIVGLFYTAPADLTNDKELYSWALQLKHHLPSLPYLKEHTVEPLVNILVSIIWTCSVLPSCLTYDTVNILGWTPNKPLTLSHPWPLAKGKDDISEIDFLRALPSPSISAMQHDFASQLANHRGAPGSRRLGCGLRYAQAVFAEPSAQGLYLTFVAQLVRVEEEIKRRNTRRKRPYGALQPTAIVMHPLL
eukprot:TRINITY_DN29533_c0_g1_i2.p1 TRINITY_DN29533_c0_g1~~TRINITY_DN29533_c0_g1_i2.p1  ORF type:complete len:471 (-),score=48.30 TRINITY_DN29533_c0_g1_i2:7-1419(-)